MGEAQSGHDSLHPEAVRDEVGNSPVDAGANDIQASYQILLIPGNQLPKTYESFLYSNWLKSLKYGNEYFKLCEPSSYFGSYKRFIASLLGRPGSVLRFATLSDDRDVLLGFSLWEPATLHYVFVKYDYRNQGVGRSLTPKGITRITHLTKSGIGYWKGQLPDAVFNPF